MKVKLALCLIVKGTKEESESLGRCLSYAASAVDGIFITITQPSREVEEVCHEFNAVISRFDWINDFAAARNFNFAQVPQEYTHILWLDADDGLRNGEGLRKILEEHPDVDTFILNYLYAFDKNKNPTVVHMKTQIVKNDGCAKWVGAIHEDLQPTRDINPYFIQGIDRIHLSDEKREEDSRHRNLEIAKEQTVKLPEDPRTWWNYGNAQRAVGDFDGAVKTFDKFLSLSSSEEEKYHAHMRRAECYWMKNDKSKAIDEARYAIGMKSEYPDAYHLLGSLFIETGQFENAAKVILQGLLKKPPYHSILVYNPRDYDYAPMKNLAKAYFGLNRPDLALPCLEGCLKVMPNDEETKKTVKLMREEVRKFNDILKIVKDLEGITDEKMLKSAIDSLPEDMRSHPAVASIRNTHFTRKKSSGKDIVFFCGNTGEIWNPATAKIKGIGGSEEAVIWLSKLLARRGWKITVYANCGGEKTYDGVKWKPYWMWNYRDKQDVVVIWRHPQHAKFEINSPVIYLDMHDAISDNEFTADRLARITRVFVKSKFHRSLFPSVPDGKIAVIPNGIDAPLFSKTIKRNPNLIVNTSSPDRSLSALLDCYEQIKKEVPDAELEWAYGWINWDMAVVGDQRRIDWKDAMQKRMTALGVKELGRLSHGEIAEKYLTANIFGYPSEFAEIDCISLSKAMAAGAVPITTDFAAMGEKSNHGGIFLASEKTKDTWAKPFHFDFSLESPHLRELWVKHAVKILKNPPSEEERETMRRWARETYDWERIANQWDSQLRQDMVK